VRGWGKGREGGWEEEAVVCEYEEVYVPSRDPKKRGGEREGEREGGKEG